MISLTPWEEKNIKYISQPRLRGLNQKTHTSCSKCTTTWLPACNPIAVGRHVTKKRYFIHYRYRSTISLARSYIPYFQWTPSPAAPPTPKGSSTQLPRNPSRFKDHFWSQKSLPTFEVLQGVGSTSPQVMSHDKLIVWLTGRWLCFFLGFWGLKKSCPWHGWTTAFLIKPGFDKPPSLLTKRLLG